VQVHPPGCDLIEVGLVYLAVGDGLGHRSTKEPVRAGHLHIEPGLERGHRVAGREPVANDEALEAPFVAKNAGEQVSVFGAVRAVEPVVGGHDAERAAVANRPLERLQVDLAQRPFVDDRVNGLALELGLVANQVLGSCCDTLALHAGHKRCCEAAAQPWIFAVALERAAIERRADQVDRGCQQHSRSLLACFTPEQRPNSFDEVRVKGRGQR